MASFMSILGRIESNIATDDHSYIAQSLSDSNQGGDNSDDADSCGFASRSIQVVGSHKNIQDIADDLNAQFF